jgi:hypothetical protein
MSVFRVKLNNVGQGLLDVNGATGVQMSTSYQRTVYVMGPKKINRKLKDGDTFTDSNYWKRFAYPQVAYADAIVEVVTDDGSVYSDVESENTFPVVYTKSVAAGSAYAANVCDILVDNGAPATFCQISHNGSAGQVAKVKLNGSSNAIFDLEYGDTQVFNSGELQITKIEFDRTTSGAAGALSIQVIVAIKGSSNS